MRGRGEPAALVAVLAIFLLFVGLGGASSEDVVPVGLGVEDVDVVVQDAGDAALALPVGDAPRASVDAVQADAAGFRFVGWADFRNGAYFVLRTDGLDVAPRLRDRSVPRVDVAVALEEPEMLYSGFEVAGSVRNLGRAKCLFVVGDDGSRLLWQSPGAACP